jgi:hypothetical protein
MASDANAIRFNKTKHDPIPIPAPMRHDRRIRAGIEKCGGPRALRKSLLQASKSPFQTQ